ncbi:MAG: aminomethyl-transferring glycine dehydrogenase subunit GcvPA [Anaerolineaceae bacterium]|nr:aminomethyl-transferring glycine dehydrogenase subunit GcvPA [Anaerolineaceae bacterium]
MYIPHTESEREEMLKAIGVEKIEDLFAAIPEQHRFPKLGMLHGMTEMEASAQLKEMAEANLSLSNAVSFLGAGAYYHYIPAAIDSLISRGEFYTAYTPYQPEISQGTLQGIFEYQSLIARLTGMDAANASHYDGATACAEAGILAYHQFRGKRKEILVSPGLHPHYQSVMRTYLSDFDGMYMISPTFTSLADVTPQKLIDAVDENTAMVIVQYPDFFGQVFDFTELAQAVHAKGALLCVCVNPIALGLLKTPGEMGADVVVGEGQPLGIPLSYGGPYLGIFAARKELIRKVSGRIVGQTIDNRGQKSYVLTLTAREQHIRREKATSNICSNQGLNALTAAIYLSLLGKEGLREVASLCYNKAHYAAQKISELKGYEILNPGPFFHEFVVKCPKPVEGLQEHLLDHNILGGYDLSGSYPVFENCLLIAVTEMNSKQDIDDLCLVLKGGHHHHEH